MRWYLDSGGGGRAEADGFERDFGKADRICWWIGWEMGRGVGRWGREVLRMTSCLQLEHLREWRFYFLRRAAQRRSTVTVAIVSHSQDTQYLLSFSQNHEAPLPPPPPLLRAAAVSCQCTPISGTCPVRSSSGSSPTGKKCSSRPRCLLILILVFPFQYCFC